jgi:hypothetical protein
VRALATTILHRSLPNPELPSQASILAGAVAAAAAAGPPPLAEPPMVSPPPTLAQIDPRWAPPPPHILSRPSPSSEPPDFGLPAPPAMARGHIAKCQIFPGASSQKYNSNSVAVFLILVNCVENHRKIRKMQSLFCWIHGELSYNFCYSGLSKFLLVFAWTIQMWKP